MRFLVLLFALLIACSPVDNVPSSPQDLSVVDLFGSPPPDLTITVSGPTRIVQRTWTGSDGVVVKMTDLYDTVEKFSCVLQTAPDGVARCMPTWFTMYYQDAGCTKPAYLLTPPCFRDKYINVYSLQCGTKILSSYRIGNKITPSKVYLLNPSGACSDATGALGGNEVYDTTPVPPSTFATGTFNY